MAKILVADDNSNVQKTVTLALAELGVEVASVNNGEAAVRKLPGFLPDLVLADIFMPVRNGYEVCEFVKNDPRFSHMPVVLLVGAFDPLDEREAQRVGADGILKKPFVPTEPLITMVKSLLARAGERLVVVAAAPHAPQAKLATEQKTTGPASIPAPEISEESTEEFPPTPGRIQFAEGDRPVAFGSFLEPATEEVAAPKPAAIEPVDDELVMTSARDTNLGDPIFWRNDSGEPREEPVPADEASAAIPSTDLGQAWKNGETLAPSQEDANLLQPVEPLELVFEEQVEALPTVASQSILVDMATQSHLSVESHKPDDLASDPLEWMATIPSPIAEAAPEPEPVLREAIPAAADKIDHEKVLELSKPKAEAISEPKAALVVAPLPPAPVEISPQIEVPGPVLVQVVEETAAPVPVVEEAAAPVADKIPVVAASQAAPPEPHADVPEKPEIVASVADQSATDTARSIPRQDWAELTASLGLQASEEVALQHKAESSILVKTPATPSATSTAATGLNGLSSSPDPALVEAVVQRVLDKMRPQVVDIITKEFLRPIVQALVHREIEKH